ncbi:MAG: hypothetical protein KDA66_09550 [Planctomycetaceae bacterium]|nr:hypothetical protein [Planctomycetaceae bacterium]
MLVARRTKWHLLAGMAVASLFVYPCIVSGSWTETPLYFWASKLFLVCFVLPCVAYLAYQFRHQVHAIEQTDDGLRFAAMTPWGRSVLQPDEILECRHVFEYETYDHLVLTVSPECVAREARSWTWSWCTSGELWFDLMYTTPSRKEVLRMIEELQIQKT